MINVSDARSERGLRVRRVLFPKTRKRSLDFAQAGQFEILESVRKVNEDQKKHFVKNRGIALDFAGKQLVLGLAFNTDDMRFAPSVDIIRCCRKGRETRVYDPGNGKWQKIAEECDILQKHLTTKARLTMSRSGTTLKMDLGKVKSDEPSTVVDGRNLLMDRMRAGFLILFHRAGECMRILVTGGRVFEVISANIFWPRTVICIDNLVTGRIANIEPLFRTNGSVT